MEGSPLGVLQAIYRYARFPNTHIWKYGLTMRDILDNHGNAIRNTMTMLNPITLRKNWESNHVSAAFYFQTS